MGLAPALTGGHQHPAGLLLSARQSYPKHCPQDQVLRGDA